MLERQGTFRHHQLLGNRREQKRAAQKVEIASGQTFVFSGECCVGHTPSALELNTQS